MSYLHFYHLKKEPFNVTPDPEFLFLSPSHKEALGVFIYGITKRKGIVAVIGEVGVGKTTVLRSYLEGVDSENLKTVYLFNANVSFPDLMRTLSDELNVQPKNDNVFDMVTQVHQALIEEYKKGRNVVLIVDEAQNTPVDTLENLRMLSNLETSKDKLIQIALIGQPELEDKLNRHELRQLKQRIAVRSTIRPLTTDESMDYIQHRLAKCRMKTEPIFTLAALKEVIKESHGIPRLMNILCDNALITGFGYQQKPVGTKIVREVIADFKGERQERPAFRWAMVSAAALVVLAVLIWAFAFRAGSVEESAASPGKSSTANLVETPAQSPSKSAAKVAAPKPEIVKPQAHAQAGANQNPAPVPAPAKTTAQASVGVREQKQQPAPESVKIEQQTVAQKPKIDQPAVAARQTPPKPVQEIKPPQKAVPVRAAAQEVSKAPAEDLHRKAMAKLAAAKSQNSKYVRNNYRKNAATSRKQYAQIQEHTPPAPVRNTTPHPSPYSPPAGTVTATTGEEQKEVPSELVETSDTNGSNPNDSALSAGGEASDAQTTEEGTQGAGSAGQHVAEPLQQDETSSSPGTNAASIPNSSSDSDTNEQVELSTEVTAPRVTRASKPIYPYSAQLRRIEGTVIVSVLVSPEGDVEAVRILRSAGSNYGLDQAAVAAVKRWRFAPGVKNGKRVRTWVSYPIVFKLR